MKKFKLRVHQLCVLIKYVYYWCYCKIFRIHNDNVWLISERGDEARDNGYAFYKYMIKNHPEEPFYYVITKDSPDLKLFSSLDHVVFYGTKKHYILFITAGYLISAHVMGCSPEFRMFNKLDKWRLLKIKGKRISLSHGVDKDKHEGLHYGNVYFDMLLAGAKPEYDFKVATYGHPKGVVKYTGYPRFDYLISKPKKQILFMPTWRMNLFYCPNVKEFKKTDYYKNWNALLNNEKLHEILEKYHYTLCFYPHYEIQAFLSAFDIKSKYIKVCDAKHYDVQTLLIESKLLVTDYSSIFFDFAYMEKPLIYFHFDYEDYRKYHFKEGYYSYQKDGFGPIYDDPDDVVRKIEKYFETNFKVEKKYHENKERFFPLCDGENSKRVYEEIKKMGKDG